MEHFVCQLHNQICVTLVDKNEMKRNQVKMQLQTLLIVLHFHPKQCLEIF